MKEYVYICLNKFGNAYISNSVYRRLGPSKILEILKNKGYNCKIAKHEATLFDIRGNALPDKEIMYIVERID